MNRRIRFMRLIKKVFKIPPEMVPPKWFAFIHMCLFPVNHLDQQMAIMEVGILQIKNEEMDRYIGELIYHITDGQMSRAYDIQQVKSVADDCVTKVVDEETQKVKDKLFDTEYEKAVFEKALDLLAIFDSNGEPAVAGGIYQKFLNQARELIIKEKK